MGGTATIDKQPTSSQFNNDKKLWSPTCCVSTDVTSSEMGNTVFQIGHPVKDQDVICDPVWDSYGWALLAIVLYTW